MKKVNYNLLMFAIFAIISAFAFVGPTDADFYAVDCSGLMGGDGKVNYDSGDYDSHAPPKCGAPRWGFGGDSEYSQFPTWEGPGDSNPFWMNLYDPDNENDGVYWVPAYVKKPGILDPPRYKAFQGFFNTSLPPRYWELVRRPENLVKVRFQSVPREYSDWGTLNDQSEGHFNFRVKKLVSNTINKFRYVIDWSQPAPDPTPGIWVSKYFDLGNNWDLKVFRPVHRFIPASGTPTAWERTDRGDPFDPEGTPVPGGWDDRDNYQCMYTIVLPTPVSSPEAYEIEVSSQIPYTLEDMDDFLESIEDKIEDVDDLPNWLAQVRTIGYGGLKYADNAEYKEENPIQVLEIDSNTSRYCVVITSGAHYEPPAPLVLEGAILEILNDIILEGNDSIYADVDFAIILLANPDGWVWGSCHTRPYGTVFQSDEWIKDLELENPGHWSKVEDGEFISNDVEAVTLQEYMAELPTTSSSFKYQGVKGTTPLLSVGLHGDACVFPDAWEAYSGSRPPANYGYATAQSNDDWDRFADEFADRLVQDNPFMRPWEEWPTTNTSYPSDHPHWISGSGFDTIIANVTLEYDEIALYVDITDYGSPTPTPACPANPTVLRDGNVWVYSVPGEPALRTPVYREYRVTCYHDDGTTYFEDWGADVAIAAADFVFESRKSGTPTPTPPPSPTPAPTPTPGGSPTFSAFSSDDMI